MNDIVALTITKICKASEFIKSKYNLEISMKTNTVRLRCTGVPSLTSLKASALLPEAKVQGDSDLQVLGH